MRIDAHRAKAEAVERSLARIALGDYEMVIEACMLAGTHWLNLLLHAYDLSAPDHDAMHAEFMTLAERRKVMCRIPAALGALDAIEALRTTHVRGDLPGGEEAAAKALASLAVLREQASAIAPVAD